MELKNYQVKIYIPDGSTYITDFYADSFELKEVYYKNLAPADNSCRIQVPFNESLSDDLKLNINKGTSGNSKCGTKFRST
jgi:hypothetical protein